MSAPLKVLIVWISIVVALVVVVFYRYDIIGGIKRTAGGEHEKLIEQPSIAKKMEESSEPRVGAEGPSSTLANGKKLYQEKTCALCHGDDGSSNTPTGQAMQATNLTTGAFKDNKTNMEAKAYILQVIENGVPGTPMVSFKAQIPSEQDRRDLADYVASLANKK